VEYAQTLQEFLCTILDRSLDGGFGETGYIVLEIASVYEYFPRKIVYKSNSCRSKLRLFIQDLTMDNIISNQQISELFCAVGCNDLHSHITGLTDDCWFKFIFLSFVLFCASFLNYGPFVCGKLIFLPRDAYAAICIVRYMLSLGDCPSQAGVLS